MSEIPASAQSALVAVCPHCQKTYAVRREHVGRSSQCRKCQQSFVIVLREATVASPPAAGVAVSPLVSIAANVVAPPSVPQAGAPLCPVCQSTVIPADTPTICSDCHTSHHLDCWEYNKGCGLYGCRKAPETEKLQDIEIPASFWGQTEKQCPSCQRVIQAAAVRCRHCGTTFQNARPQQAAEFVAQVDQKRSLVKHRRFGIALLIAAVIPCTAPLAAVVGIVWFLAARRSIAVLPPLQATICRMAVGVALAVSMIMAIIAVVYSLHT